MHIDIWSDIACPWCAIGKQHLETALAEFKSKQAGQISVRWRSFQLNPHAKQRAEEDYAQALASKYGLSRVRAQEMIDTMAVRGADIGVPFDFAIIQAGNTFDCHRLLHLAFEDGLQDALKGRLFTAYFGEGQLMSDHGVLQRLAVEVGLDAQRVAAVLAGDAFAEAVRIDQRTAGEIGVRGVPFFVVDNRLGVSGAQPPEVLLQMFEQVVTEQRGTKIDTAPTCAEDGCETPEANSP